MTDGSPLDALAAKLIDGCRDGTYAAWVDALGARADEFAVATGGVPVVIEVAPTGMRTFRLGILSDGQLQVPIGTRGPVRFRLQGDPHKVARFALGEGTLLDAQEQGLLVFGSPRPATARLIGRLRRVVADELRGLLQLPALVAVGARRWMARLQPIDHPMAEAAYVANCVVAVVVAVCSAVVGMPATEAPTHLSTAATVQAAPGSSDELEVVATPTAPGPTAAARPTRGPLGSSKRAPTASTSTQRTKVTAGANTPDAGLMDWTVLTVDCGHGTGRLLCAALQQVPPPDRPDRPSVTAAPGTARR